MKISIKIKQYREQINLSQEDLANKIYVSRQTISNWENNKSYPDINSIKLLSNVFGVTIDEFIESDLTEMKKIISEYDLKKYNKLSIIYSIEFLILIFGSYPLLRFCQILGIIIWLIIFLITFTTSLKIEKIYRQHDCRTYKEIVAFTEGRTLSAYEQIEEKAKRPYQKFLLALFSGIIAIVIFTILDLIFG